jgi:hypothetical protein
VQLTTGEVLLEGPLHGKILPSESMWAIMSPDPTARFRGARVMLSLEKAYGSRDIWATVFDRVYVAENLNNGNENELQ